MILLQLAIHQERSNASPLLNVKNDYAVLCVGLLLAVGFLCSLCSVAGVTSVCSSDATEFLYQV